MHEVARLRRARSRCEDVTVARAPHAVARYIRCVSARRLPVVTFGLLALVIAGGVVVPMTPTPQDLIAAGASYGPRSLDAEPWRVLTAALVHAGAAHLIVNAITIALFGVVLELRAGRWATAMAFAGSSVVGTAAGTVSAPYAVIAGASSGALGLAAALVVVMAVSAMKHGPRRIDVVLLAIAMSVIVAHVVIARGRDDIDQVGHVGGLLAGAVMGALFARAARATATASAAAAETATAAPTAAAAATPTATAAAVAAAAAVIAVVALIVAGRPAPYEPRRATAHLVAIEKRFDELVDPRTNVPRGTLPDVLEREVVAPLEAIAKDARLDDARMSAKLRTRVMRLKTYARARADVVRQFANAVRKDDVAPLVEIERASREADAILDGPLP
jgi:membrane associated rhomboid family serine protease